MTHGEWVKLIPQEQRIKVAELCGWERDYKSNLRGGPVWVKNGSIAGFDGLPEYLNDLNAMHGVEMNMPNQRLLDYDTILWNICQNASGKTGAIHATARQRAEAFVLTMEPE